MNSYNILKFTSLFLTSLFFSVSLHTQAATSVAPLDCDSAYRSGSSPIDIVRCGLPSQLNVTTTGRSLFDIIMIINNTLAIIAIFLSIIGVMVGLINLAKSQGEKDDYKEAKRIITNSFLAFFLTAALWLIVSLVLNSFGAGSIVPIINPTNPPSAAPSPGL